MCPSIYIQVLDVAAFCLTKFIHFLLLFIDHAPLLVVILHARFTISIYQYEVRKLTFVFIRHVFYRSSNIVKYQIDMCSLKY